jgi:hypothetical protein
MVLAWVLCLNDRQRFLHVQTENFFFKVDRTRRTLFSFQLKCNIIAVYIEVVLLIFKSEKKDKKYVCHLRCP